MRKLIFTSLIDATLNRIGSFFSNVFLRRMATHVAASEALDIAAIEERIEQLESEGRPIAAKRLAAHLDDLRGDDPTHAMSTGFCLANYLPTSLQMAPPALPDLETKDSKKPKRGRSRGHSETALQSK